MTNILSNPVFIILFFAVILNLLYFLNIRLKPVSNAFLFSVFFHTFLLLGISFKASVGEITDEYKLVQLVDIKEMTQQTTQKSEVQFCVFSKYQGDRK